MIKIQGHERTEYQIDLVVTMRPVSRTLYLPTAGKDLRKTMDSLLIPLPCSDAKPPPAGLDLVHVSNVVPDAEAKHVQPDLDSLQP